MSEQTTSITKETRDKLEALLQQAAIIQQPLWDVINEIQYALRLELNHESATAEWTDEFLDIAFETAQEAIYCNDFGDASKSFTPARMVDKMLDDVESEKRRREEWEAWCMREEYAASEERRVNEIKKVETALQNTGLDPKNYFEGVHIVEPMVEAVAPAPAPVVEPKPAPIRIDASMTQEQMAELFKQHGVGVKA